MIVIFKKNEYEALPLKLQDQIYQVANVFLHKELILKLREYGMHEEKQISPKGPRIFSDTMDGINVENTLADFFKNLRRKGLLLTQQEFAQYHKSRY